MAPRHSYNGTLLQLGRPRVPGPGEHVAGRHRGHRRGRRRTGRRRRPGLARVADQPVPRARRHRHHRGRAHDGRRAGRGRQHVRHSAPPAAARPRRRPRGALGDEVPRRPQRRPDGRGRGGDDELWDVLKGRRDLLGNDPGPLEAWLALRGLRTLHVRVERAQANAAELARRLGDHPLSPRSATPGSARWSRSSCPRRTQPTSVPPTTLWVHATSLGGVESTLERRRRWASEPARCPTAWSASRSASRTSRTCGLTWPRRSTPSAGWEVAQLASRNPASRGTCSTTAARACRA